MPSASKLWRRSSGGSFFQENPLRILKRRAQAAHRRRCTVDEPPPRAQPSTSPSTPPASHCEPSEPAPAPAPAAAPAPTTQRATADSSSQTDLSIPPSADDPDPFSEELEPAIEVDSCDIIPPPRTPTPPPSKADVSTDLEVPAKINEKADPNAPVPGPDCPICHEPTGVPRTDVGPEAGKFEQMAMLPCGHMFGHTCLLQWIDQEFSHTCPLCRAVYTHPECKHSVLPTLADGAPPSVAKGGKLSPQCQMCSYPADEGKQVLKYRWRVREARGMALVSMRQVPAEWAESRLELEWHRIDERSRSVKVDWDETLEQAWLESQIGRSAW